MAAGSNLNTNETRKSLTTHLAINDFGFDNHSNWDDLHVFVPEPSPSPGPGQHGRLEDEESEQVQETPDTKNRRFIETYPRAVGSPIGRGKTKFQEMYDNHILHSQSIHAPFTNDEEWELAQWLSRRVGQKAMDEYLNLSIVSSNDLY
jgi:hypothetical protein